jgi:hypothetical protein
MTITIDLAPELEQQIRQAAAQAGLAPAAYITETLRQQLHSSSRASIPRVSAQEADLLLTINQSMSAIEWAHYHDLIAKRHATTLTMEDQGELIRLTDAIELANAARIAAAAELAQLRHTTLDALLRELGLVAPSHV